MDRPARIIEVVAYDPQWPERFRSVAERIAEVLGDAMVAIDHVGSTAVPGLAAKPIIDLLLEVRSLAELDERTPALEALGFRARGENGIAGRRYFVCGGERRTHHLHAYAKSDLQLHRHRAFRDYLIAHPEVAERYADLKRRAADRCRHDSRVYAALKASFIEAHERRALAELGSPRAH